ncbi:zinc finger C2HC domain-containing protein 1C-like [Dreissena polymorpha]|uniref:C2HC/C3H-type domain-containing protein n=1 Tax=Dreissena polymorpha TaxID=45954 RepID=A0A9D4QVJ4_DREPO|nr:zinc finger C2HC domain-containing protein 1C-like [Dreissena polymorpha]XP_052273003.1 zinc finger C2HC domain-containing protein 1C-like [Dreissena polymorpha]XP_052273004.1 zinc finger C2HC domain-containing protein 1C-like [Dreissena polymorpha]XP_052273005.1 zinc finger C2HC domain-containing protein 1C-like [Dreissena polymorpha]KAH3845221.1 hypothetical protein DPMN_087496 [Dreissena polymorpha]
MDRNGVMQGGSRIPRFAGAGGTMASTNYRTEPLPDIGQKPSRLQMMQQEIQKNILKEKENKIINMYEENQQKALQKVNSGRGHVRDFFEQRRKMGPTDNLSPTMEQLYQQKKSESQVSGFSNSSGRVNNRFGYGTNTQQKLSAGRDRSNLLAPIQKNGGQNADGNPFGKKPQIVRPRTYTGKGMPPQNKENVHVVSHFTPKSAPAGEMFNHSQNNYEDETPPPNPQQLARLQQKRKMLQQQQQGNKNVGPQKQLMKNNRHGRNQFEYEPSDEEDDEGFDDNSTNSGDDELKRKQQELLAQIEAQQRELDRLRNERMQAEIEERKEEERRRKVDDERRKQQAEDLARRRREDEEERMREQFDDEKRLKIEEEKQRMKKTGPPLSRMTNKSVIEARHQDSYSHREDYEENTPTPPPHPKPANTRKSVPQKRAQPQKNSPSPPPLPKSDVSLYDNAIALEGAFENVGHLKACYNCGRSFAADRLEKHEQACKNITKKRKVMDSSKLRTRGTELEQYVAKASKSKASEKSGKKKGNWRSQHASFIEAIRYAKKCSQIEKEGGKLSDLPPPPVSENPDYVQCPYCTRKFNSTAAERHIPHCKNSRAKPPPKR